MWLMWFKAVPRIAQMSLNVHISKYGRFRSAGLFVIEVCVQNGFNFSFIIEGNSAI